MTNSWLRALILLSLLGLAACGGGGGGSASSIPTDTAPSVSFAFGCSDLACSFTNTSTDQDAGDSLSYVWSFGDGGAPVTTANASHTYAAAGTYNVSLTATDNHGVAGTPKTSQVTVTAAPAPAAPHASFTVSCSSLDCTFTDTSTYDAGSVLQSRVWDFGDSATLTAAGPVTTHSYAATVLSTYSVKLSITDAAGKVSTSSQSIPVAPPATTLNCVGGGCVLSLTQASTVTATLVSHSCSAHGNQVVVTAPVPQTIVPDGCFSPVGTVVPLNGGSSFAANTVLQVAVLSGLSGTTALVFPPALRVTGDFATGWTLTFDDGFGGPGEPDFNDLVILIKATP